MELPLKIIRQLQPVRTWEMTVVAYSIQPGMAPSVRRIRKPEARPNLGVHALMTLQALFIHGVQVRARTFKETGQVKHGSWPLIPSMSSSWPEHFGKIILTWGVVTLTQTPHKRKAILQVILLHAVPLSLYSWRVRNMMRLQVLW